MFSLQERLTLKHTLNATAQICVLRWKGVKRETFQPFYGSRTSCLRTGMSEKLGLKKTGRVIEGGHSIQGRYIEDRLQKVLVYNSTCLTKDKTKLNL